MGCSTSNQTFTRQPRLPTPKTPTPTPKTPTPTPTPLPPTPLPPTPLPPTREVTTDFDSDHINIQIEKGKDDNRIAPTEENYPPPIPPNDSGRNIRPKDVWFEDENFENSSEDADLLDFYKIETATDDDEIDLDEISDTTSVTGRSTKDIVIRNATPSTVAKSKVTFEEVDAHARRASPNLTNSFEDLIKYLSTPLAGDLYRGIKLARAIVIWLSEQKLDFIHGTASMNSPNGLLLFLKEQRMTYTTCYAILCRKAGLSCTILKGYVKAAEYEPGADVVPESTWNAVHVEGGWQLVHTFWVCRALYGHNLGGWVKIEVDGAKVLKTEKASHGVLRSTFQEHYFMPKPEEFIYYCYAKDTCWQLVNKSLEVHTMKQFLEMPYLLPPFFGLGLQLVSENKCVLESVDGFCKIEFKANNANAHMIMLKYELYKKVCETFEKDQEMTRMVFNSRANENFMFEIRFPCEGSYKLVIYGGPHKSAALRLCEFKLVCTKKMIGYNLLPLECRNIGWGPGPVTFEAGLLMPSRPNGLIPVNKTDRKTDIKFLISDKFVKKHEYSVNLHGEIDGKRKTFIDSVKTILDTSQQKQLMITAVLPTEGEYGLEILHSSDEVRDETICNYLLSTKAYRAAKANIKNAKEELKAEVEKNVKDEDLRKKIESINECITKCQKQKIANSDEDMCVAFSWLEFFLYKNLLRDCHLRRNIHVTRNILRAIGRFKNKDALISQITRVEQLEKELLELNGHARKVPKLENAKRAIVSLKSPSEEVFATFKALLMLLGTPEKLLDDWGYIQSQLREATHTEPQSVLGKMKRIQKQSVTLQQRKKVKDLLQKFSEDQVRKSNSDAHSFYVWKQQMKSIMIGQQGRSSLLNESHSGSLVSDDEINSKRQNLYKNRNMESADTVSE